MGVMQHPDPSAGGQPASALGEFLVVCLCAEWCGVCREYRSGFAEIAAAFPEAGFYWLDIEAHADEIGDIDVDNFPTLLIKRQQSVLFFGSMPPAPAHLRRTFGAFLQQGREESRAYAASSIERRHWQQMEDLQRLDQAELQRICG